MASKIKVIPLLDRVLVKQDDEPQKTEGGIFLPDTAKEAPQWGTVVRVGPGKVLDNGEKRPMTVKEGDKVIFGKYSGTKVKMGQDELLFMREEDIMAVVED
ncbi:MAG: co-chaperone GroES [Proteobacteria bacterium]|nr:co-chaperone GroES [Pseudomonadota bacterium]